MKIAPFLATGLITLAITSMSGQQPPQGVATVSLNSPAPASAELTKFDLDFPGGRPQDLVAAIQKSLAKPLNAIIPDEHVDTLLPALKMKNVDASQLFSALQLATSKTIVYSTGGGAFGGYNSYQQYQSSCGFKSGSGKLSDDTIWYFKVDRPPLPDGASVPKTTKVCRFYSLAPYLERHLTVDDITTAIETGWKMLGEPARAVINFHKDTKLLIAVGEPSALETIDAVLKALDEPKAAAPPSKPAPAPKPAEKPSAPEEK